MVGGGGRQALARFVDELKRLRRLAGSPSLNQLAALTLGLERPLPRSTTSDKLNGKSLPDWDFVVSFVTGCKMHADKLAVRLPAELMDLTWWDTTHLEMLRAFDDIHADERLAVAAEAELSRRRARATPSRSSLSRQVGGNPHVIPRQLPLPPRHFAGRVAELEELTGLLEAAVGSSSTVVISAIDGTAGVGKTALAVYWSHQVAERFPDGQLYVNLRGFGPTESPVMPAEAVRAFLDALEVPPERIPASLDAQAALYRSLLAGRRMLVVLDNARDAEQVRPLLPSSIGCLALVTSRNRLTSLIATEGAYPVTLDLFTTAEAWAMLAQRLGADRVAAEPKAANKIITLCARLPLALAVMAARAAEHPTFPLAALADELGDAHGGLYVLDGGDPGMNVRRVFSWSYQRLGVEAARLFRLMGLHCGPEIGLSAVASLAGVPIGHIRPVLADLTRTHLIEEPTLVS